MEEEVKDVSSFWMTLKKRLWEIERGSIRRTLWRTRFGRGYGPVVRQATEW
jgi:hypothetical protein